MPTLGYTADDIGGWSGSMNTEVVYGLLEVTATEDGTCTALAANVDQNQGNVVDVDIALYDSSGNLLISGLCTHSSGVGGDFEWIEYTGFSQAISNAATYYIAVSGQGAGGQLQVLRNSAGSDAAELGSTNSNPCTDGDFDDPISVPAINGNSIAAHLTYTATGGATGPNLLTLLGVG